MKRLWPAVCCALCLAGPQLPAAPGIPTEPSTGVLPTGPEWRIYDFARDASGQVQGIGSRDDPADPSDNIEGPRLLVVYDATANSWHEVRGSKPGPGMVPQALATLESGSVACYWHNGSDGAVTLHQLNRGHFLGAVTGGMAMPRLLALSDGGLAMTGRGARAFRLRGPAPAQAAMLALRDEWLLPPFAESPGERNYMELQAVGLPGGGLVLWNHSTQVAQGLWRLSGPLVWGSGGEGRLTKIILAAEAPMTALVPGDNGSLMVVAAAGRGLMNLDPGTGFWGHALMPEPRWNYIEDLFSSGGCNYIITAPPPTTTRIQSPKVLEGHLVMERTLNYDSSRRTGSLWRHDLEANSIREMVQGLDWEPRAGSRGRPILTTSHGILLGSHDSGPWWIPSARGATPRRLERGDGFTLGHADGLVTLGSKGFLARQDSGYWQYLAWPADHAAEDRGRMAEILTGDFLVSDQRFGLWGFTPGRGSVVHWDGTKWTASAAPEAITDGRILEFAADGRDQGWVFALDAGRTAVVDFKSGEWAIFDSQEQAVAARLKAGDAVKLRRNGCFGVASHENGGQGFIDWDGIVHVRTEGIWERFQLKDIAGDEARVTGIPCFNAAGHYCVWLRHKPWQYEGGGHWAAATEPEDAPETTRPAEPPPPAEFPVPGVQSTCYDRHGVAWVVMRDGSLWKWLDGVAVQIKDGARTLHLPPRTGAEEVLLDAGGTAFLRHAGAGAPTHYLAIRPAEMAAGAGASVSVEAMDTVVLKAPADLAGWWRWREADLGQWSALVRDSSLTLTGLRPGPHRWEIQCFNAELSVNGAPARVEVELKAGGDNDFDHLISRLSARDGKAREAAARMLRSQGPAVVPALKKALSAAADDESSSWWLRAVLAEIERNAPERE